jgi:hypothetical protein
MRARTSTIGLNAGRDVWIVQYALAVDPDLASVADGFAVLTPGAYHRRLLLN